MGVDMDGDMVTIADMDSDMACHANVKFMLTVTWLLTWMMTCTLTSP